ncbi:MAG: aldehyde dehydrogenase family protein [Chloracidobacterium sp.]|uniref:Aldehyde dehydrogenase family protein n=1 Tax=Chloracidobacterium validum TaxID=2821543 RepID=A0ABX8BB16_9BACT|nr:aldehyde dehydrogenase family protein [Chloracidobacterium validum]QUW03874.1 aldehyde dehydrogenase family protein [Chloracidobacterium validum]
MPAQKASNKKASKTSPATYANYINGAWVAAQNGETFANHNPADAREVVGYFPNSTAEDIDAAVAAAADAYPRWRLVPPPKRAEYIFRVGEILIRDKEAISRDMTREMGKVLKETRGDTQEAIDMAYFVAGEGRRLHGQTTTSELTDKFAMTVRDAIGVCGLITPWNFPIAIPSWKILPAILCGNTVVIKPAEDTPLSVYRFVKAFEEAGLPPGVVNMVTGYGETAGAPLVTHPTIRLVSFTGSTQVGRIIATQAADKGKKCSLEMGGKNAILVMDDANLDLAVEGAVWGAFGTAGQRCTAASRLIVHKKVVKKFTQMLVERTKGLRLGNGLDPATDVGPVVNQDQLERVLNYIAIGRTQDKAKLLCGGERITDGDLAHGYFIAPTVFGDVAPNATIAQEEIFGPVTAVIPCQGFEDAIAIANGVGYGLSASIYTGDVNRAFQAMRDLETGICYVNAPTIGAEVHLPFGGVKGTGNGHREGGLQALDIFSEWKTLYVDFSGRLQKAQITD